MKMHLMLAVNDSNGAHTGQVDRVEVDNLIYLEGDPVSCHALWPRTFEIDGLHFNLKGYKAWVGNMCWDCATLEHVHVSKIVEHLRSIGWGCTEAETSLFEAYHNRQPITAEILEDLTCSPSP
jgi:hypothetical protein